MKATLPVLIVDDDQGTRETCSTAFDCAGIATEAVATLTQARAAVKAREFELIVLDRWLGQDDGFDLLRSASRIPRTLVVSAFADVPSTVEAMRLGAVDVLEKPVSIDALLWRVTNLIDIGGRNELSSACMTFAQRVSGEDCDLLTFIDCLASFPLRRTGAIGPISLWLVDRRVGKFLKTLGKGNACRKSECAWAKELAIDPAHLGRVLRHDTGIGFREWRRIATVRRALTLMVHHADCWKQVAHEVGIPQSQLTREFRATLGVSPREFLTLASGRPLNP